MHVQKQIDKEIIKEFEIKSLGNVSFDDFYRHDLDMGADESPFDTESKIKLVGKVVPELNVDYQVDDFTLADQDMKEINSSLESMPEDELLSVSGFEANDAKEDNKSKNKAELSKDGEATANNVLDELVDMANSQDANLNAFTDKTHKSNLLGHLHEEFSSLTTKVDQLKSLLAQRVADKIQDSMPKMVVDASEERIPDLLSNTLKNILPQIIKESVNQALSNFDKRVDETLKA
ncbi:hypothetical protein Tco_0492745 [Tanacetum coccineum]